MKIQGPKSLLGARSLVVIAQFLLVVFRDWLLRVSTFLSYAVVFLALAGCGPSTQKSSPANSQEGAGDRKVSVASQGPSEQLPEGWHSRGVAPPAAEAASQEEPPQAAAAAEENPPKGDLWAFTVGVSKYKSPQINSLQFADNDAKSLADTLSLRCSKRFQKVHTKSLLNEQADRQSIEHDMQSFFAPAGRNDVALIALMGHGVLDNSGSRYFMPYPADLDNLDSEGLPMVELDGQMKDVGKRVKALVIVFDACHAGMRSRGVAPVGRSVLQAVDLHDELPNDVDAYLLSSSAKNEDSMESLEFHLPDEPTKGHGAFTYALLRGLNGEAETTVSNPGQPVERAITVDSLFGFAAEEVPLITDDMQHPFHRIQGSVLELADGPPVAGPQAVKNAEALVQVSKEQQKRGDLNAAETSLAKAETLSPRDQTVQIQRGDVKEEMASRDDPAMQQDIVGRAQWLFEHRGKVAPVGEWDPRPLIVTFLDFSTSGGKPEQADMHTTIVERVSDALSATKRIKVVDRRLLDKILQELELSMSSLSDPDTQLRIGKILLARVIASGNLDLSAQPKLTFTVKLTDTETTEIIGSISKEGTADSVLKMTDQIAAGLANELRKDYPIRGKIVAMDGTTALLNVGAKQGVMMGTKMRAVVEEPLMVDGKILDQITKPIGSLEVTEVGEKSLCCAYRRKHREARKGNQGDRDPSRRPLAPGRPARACHHAQSKRLKILIWPYSFEVP